eukprot:5165088-Prymnesium_polylepis.3
MTRVDALLGRTYRFHARPVDRDDDAEHPERGEGECSHVAHPHAQQRLRPPHAHAEHVCQRHSERVAQHGAERGVSLPVGAAARAIERHEAGIARHGERGTEH